MKILSITTGVDPQVGLILFGLGDDNMVYRWDAKLGGWQKNWFENPAPAKRTAKPAEKRKK